MIIVKTKHTVGRRFESIGPNSVLARPSAEKSSFLLMEASDATEISVGEKRILRNPFFQKFLERERTQLVM